MTPENIRLIKALESRIGTCETCGIDAPGILRHCYACGMSRTSDQVEQDNAESLVRLDLAIQRSRKMCERLEDMLEQNHKESGE